MAVNRGVIGGPTALSAELGPGELGEPVWRSRKISLSCASAELAADEARDAVLPEEAPLAPELLHAVNAMGADTAKTVHTANRDTLDLRMLFDDRAVRFNTVSL